MAHHAMASKCPGFDHHFDLLDSKLKKLLGDADFATALQWASTFESVASSTAASQELLEMLLSLGASAEEAVAWLPETAALYAVACDLAPAAHRRAGSLQGLALSADLESHKRAAHHLVEKADLRKLEVAALTSLPTAWRGKVYRRTETAETAHKRDEDEQLERARWAKELAGLLLEAGLPFARNLRGSPLDGAALRCCRGLRARTLAQRVSCWRPFRRWLLTTTGAPWPRSTADLLDYFEVRRSEGAPRTAYSSLLSSLRFLEEAGEVAEADRLHCNPALGNAQKELALAAAAEAAQTSGSHRARGQAPQLPLAVLAALEEVVLNPQLPAYHRAFAGFRLLRHWASLRWDDTQGLPPGSFETRARGIAGTLDRTKTSGRGKLQQVLPVFWSSGAYLRHEWLAEAVRLLTEDSFGFERDFLLPLPADGGFAAASRRRALYSDSAAFSQSLWASLVDAEGEPLLPHGAGSFFTEHSDRAGLDSWAASLGVGSSERAFLGRWRASGSTDSYVRTALRVVENVQLLTASRAQESLDYGPDFFGEEELLTGMRKHLVARGWSLASAEALESRLQVANYSLNPQALLPDLSKDWSLTDWAAEPAAPETVTISEEIVAVMPPPAPDAELKAAFEKALEADRAPPATVQGYVVSITRGGRHRKLHHVGSCRFTPGVDDKDFEVYGDVMPGAAEVDSRCAWCFGRGLSLEPALEEEGSGSESLDSSSSSTVERPALKKARKP